MKFAIDSNVTFIATGQIGEAWAVVILEEISKGKLDASQSILHILEILDTYTELGEKEYGKKMYTALKRIVPKIHDVTVDDFLASAKNTKVAPREDLISKSLIRNGIKNIFSVDGPLYQELNVIHLKKLLSQLNLPGNYINERFKNKNSLS